MRSMSPQQWRGRHNLSLGPRRAPEYGLRAFTQLGRFTRFTTD